MSEAWWQDRAAEGKSLGPLMRPSSERIEGALERDRFPQSLLLVGPPRLGRELVAGATAAMLTCPEQRAGCDCPSCRRVLCGHHPDVALVLPEGAGRQIKIAQVRKVVSEVAGRPYEASRRVWIFDGVEASSFGAEAANAFLKTLEEPPAHAVFLLLAANPTAVLATIVSRCQQLALPGPVAVASALAEAVEPLELAATSLDGQPVDERLKLFSDAFESAAAGEPRLLLKAAHLASDDPRAFELAAAAALQVAGKHDLEPAAAGLVRLAAELLVAERRSRALNLGRGRQLLACLLAWHHDSA